MQAYYSCQEYIKKTVIKLTVYTRYTTKNMYANHAKLSSKLVKTLYVMLWMSMKKKKIHQCDQCANRFMSKYYLGKHIKEIHLKKREFFCGQCRRDFTQKSSLNRHMRTKHKNEESS